MRPAVNSLQLAQEEAEVGSELRPLREPSQLRLGTQGAQRAQDRQQNTLLWGRPSSASPQHSLYTPYTLSKLHRLPGASGAPHSNSCLFWVGLWLQTTLQPPQVHNKAQKAVTAPFWRDTCAEA